MMWESILKLVVVFPFIIFLLIITLKLIQHVSIPVNHKKKMMVIEQLRMNSKVSLSIVKINDKYLLVSSCETEIKILEELDKTQFETKDTAELSTSFFEDIPVKMLQGRWKREKKN